jgi:hypothetical protein
MQAPDIVEMATCFAPLGKGRPQFERYLREHEDGTRTVLIARAERTFAGYVTVLWSSA